MGTTTVKLKIQNPKLSAYQLEADFVVDSGAHYTVLPKRLVERLKLKAEYEQEFALADGRVIKRQIGAAVIYFQNRKLPAPVVLGEKDDSPLLGVTTLEIFGMMLDPFKRTIYPARLMLG